MNMKNKDYISNRVNNVENEFACLPETAEAISVGGGAGICVTSDNKLRLLCTSRNIQAGTKLNTCYW